MSKIICESFIGTYEVISTGSIIAINNLPIKFKIPPLEISIEFINDNTIDDAQVITEPLGPMGLLMKLVNCNNQLGNGNVGLFEVGNINSRKLYLNFEVIHSEGAIGKTFHYTWFMEGE